MANTFAVSDGPDASAVANDFNSSDGFRDFFEINWSENNYNYRDILVFFDTHQRDFDNILKARALGFQTFLVDDNYHTDGGDMNGHSIKQVFYRVGGQASNLASVLDYYYEMPPIINPLLMDNDLKGKYPKIFEEITKHTATFQSQSGKPATYVFDPVGQEMGLYQEPLLDLSVPDDRKFFEKLAETIEHKEFAWYNHMAVMGVYKN
jgi:hypothetical protein